MKTKNLLQGILSKDRLSLSKAITLIESSRADDRMEAANLLQSLPGSSSSLRIGLCGSPGAGKSSLIESIGMQLISQNYRPAVLAMDPSSIAHGGSVLGDKTRMQELSASSAAYVRPSPTRGVLGGISTSCSETIQLCEAAGFNPIIIETVGLGQSETTIDEVSDIVLLITSPAGGDGLQGIKKGIMEIADVIAVNKCEEPWLAKAKNAQIDLEQAVRLNARRYKDWIPPVVTCSAHKRNGIHELIETIFKARTEIANEIQKKRIAQEEKNCHRVLESLVKNKIYKMKELEHYKELIAQLKNREVVSRMAALKMFDLLIRNN